MTKRAASSAETIAIPVLVAVLVCLTLFSEGAFQRLIAPDMDAEGNPILRVMWLPVYGVVACLALTRAKEITQLALRMPMIVALVILAAASFLWSIDPSVSMRRGFGLAMTTLFGFYLAARFSWRQLLVLLGGLWLFLCVVNFTAGLVSPGFARDFDIHNGAWRGFWYEKNTMGGHMARASMIFGALLLIDQKRWRIWGLGLGLTIALVLFSDSATALMAMLLAGGILVTGWMFQGRRVMAVVGVWGALSVAGGLAAFIALQPEAVLAIFGKDTTLTGRTDIWAALVDAISQRPLLGYGYGAFWGPDSHPAYWVRESVDWGAPTAHNTWLEITLALGFVGLALFAINFAATFMRALRDLPDHRFALFAVGFLVQLSMFSMSESLLLELNSLVWISYVAVAGTLLRGLSRDGTVEHSEDTLTSRLRLRRQSTGAI